MVLIKISQKLLDEEFWVGTQGDMSSCINIYILAIM